MEAARRRKKAAENRLRRAAERQGYRLEKRRTRDPNSLGHNTFRLVDTISGETIASSDPLDAGFGLTTKDVNALLRKGRSR